MSPVSARPSTAESVAELVREKIRTGGFVPGERLPPQRELAAILEVSRASVGEGLRILAEQEYVDIRRGATGGAFVTQLDRPLEAWKRRLRTLSGELDELTELRMAVESELARLAAERARRPELVAMHRANQRLARAEDASAGDVRGHFRSADSDFHDALATAARNDRLARIATAARAELFVPYDLVPFDEPIGSVLDDHRQLLRAVQAGDGDEAAAGMRRHITRTRAQLSSYLRRGD